MRRIIVHGAAVLMVAAVAWQYARFTWDEPWRADQIVMGMEERPYVYRALVPFVARGLVWLGMPADVALNVVVVLCAIGFFYGLLYFFKSVR